MSADSSPDQLVVLRVYRDVDRATSRELKRLRDREGVVPTCRRGCSHCCEQEIPVTLPEARVIAAYIRSEYSPLQRTALRERLVGWFRWIRQELPRHIAAGAERSAAIYEHAPSCVLLEKGECSVYPVRPTICRTHYVSSDPRSCMPRSSPGASAQPPVVLESLHARTGPHIRRIRQYIEGLGLEFDDAVSSLPRWLAVELGWSDLLRAW